MGDESSGGWQMTKLKKKAVPALSPEAEARLIRGMAVLVGLVPLPDMTQAETDWLFEQRVRLANDS